MTTLLPSPWPTDIPAVRRTRRVLVLLIGVIVLSAADLALTMTHLTTIGMIEANPVAAWLIRTTASPWAICLFKALTVAACCGSLWLARRHTMGEVGAWFCVVVLALLAVQWHRYASTLEDPLDIAMIVATPHLDESWVVLD